MTGNNLILNLRVGVQRIAESALAGKCGAAVMLNPKTGAVYVMASSPSYDPNKINSDTGYASILKSPSACPGSTSALLNRATQGLYPPGSTFKTVTAAAALDSGTFKEDSPFYDPGYCVEYGQHVSNAGNPEAPETFGHVDFLQAYEHSINAVFCNIGMKLGAGKIIDKAKDFGFYSEPPIETAVVAGRRRAASTTSRRAACDLFDDAGPDGSRAASPSARTSCSSRRCRWRSSRPRSRTGAQSWSRISSRR